MATLIVTAVAAAAAVAGAIVSGFQARAARTSKKDAEESARLAAASTAAVVKRADVAEKALALEEERAKPPAWTHRFVAGDTYAMVNTSNRTIHLEGLEVEPDGTEHLFSVVAAEQDRIYEVGQSFDFMVPHGFFPRPRRLVITWRFADQPDESISSTAVPL